MAGLFPGDREESFVVILALPSEDRLRIPDDFVRSHMPVIPPTVTLCPHDGIRHTVFLKKLGGAVYLDEGWAAFRDAYALTYFDILQFNYDLDDQLVMKMYRISGMQNKNTSVDPEFVLGSDDIPEYEQNFVVGSAPHATYTNEGDNIGQSLEAPEIGRKCSQKQKRSVNSKPARAHAADIVGLELRSIDFCAEGSGSSQKRKHTSILSGVDSEPLPGPCASIAVALEFCSSDVGAHAVPIVACAKSTSIGGSEEFDTKPTIGNTSGQVVVEGSSPSTAIDLSGYTSGDGGIGICSQETLQCSQPKTEVYNPGCPSAAAQKLLHYPERPVRVTYAGHSYRMYHNTGKLYPEGPSVPGGSSPTLPRIKRSVLKNPFGSVVISESDVEGVSLLKLPYSFAAQHLKEGENCMTFQTGGQVDWSVTCHLSPNYAYATLGWKKFVVDNKIVPGDVCIFMWNKQYPQVWDVKIIEAPDAADASASPDNDDA